MTGEQNEAGGERLIGKEHDGALIDSVVRALFELSWGRARDLVRRGKVSVNGHVITQTTIKVYSGSKLALDLTARDPRSAKSALDRDAVVFADGHVVVVEKPAGVSTVPYDPEGMGASIAKRNRPGEEATLDHRVRLALAKRDRARGRGGPPPEIGIVHRLDKETSGLIVFTRSWAAKKALTDAFRSHTVHRRYLGIVHGIPEGGTIVSHFVEDRGDGLRGSIEQRRGRNYAVGSEKTQRAVTHVEVIERFPAFEGGGAGQPCALVACRLETGRTHQIRIHLAEQGHPLLGERVYIRGYDRPLVPAPRIMLHAAELGFVHPGSAERHGVARATDLEDPEVDEPGGEDEESRGEEMRWTSPLPSDMLEMCAFLRHPAAKPRTTPPG